MSSGWLCIAGLGPGAVAMITPEVSAALAAATDVVGYLPYVARIAPRAGLRLHPSDNRVEMERARAALAMAADGHRVVLVSSGDPGVFAMAAAVFEALEAAPHWQQLDIRVLPGITAMLAAAAKAGAPLGHDFCAINLSDNLKPAALIEARVRAAAGADFALAFYNPRSASVTVWSCSSGVLTARAKVIKRSGPQRSRSSARMRPKVSGRLAERGL